MKAVSKITASVALAGIIAIAGTIFPPCFANNTKDTTVAVVGQNVLPPVNPVKVLIVYYSHSGKTKEVAEIIARQTSGTLYRIETVKDYSSISVFHALSAKKELESGNLPELSTAIPDISGYDLIIVGSPVWRHTVATPVVSFLAQCDFGEKPVAAYATNKGNVGSFFTLFEEKVRNARLLPGEEFHNNLSGKDELSQKISKWLNTLASESTLQAEQTSEQ
ncbi:MAG: hypothetical protein LBL33_04140 [Tannerella sp.]|jgi:flavodoxin|nr:hypothetical protein [Tannerella sp.]